MEGVALTEGNAKGLTKFFNSEKSFFQQQCLPQIFWALFGLSLCGSEISPNTYRLPIA